jgi:alpha-glucosidase
MITSFFRQGRIFCLAGVFAVSSQYASAQQMIVKSPDQRVVATIEQNEGKLQYRITFDGNEMIHPSPLGLVTSAGDLSNGLKFDSMSKLSVVTDRYELFTGKRRSASYKANKRTMYLSAGKLRLGLVFQLSNDGVAFQYQLRGNVSDTLTVTDENTAYVLDTSTRGFLQPMQVAKTGFQQSNPAYEDNYKQGIAAGTPSPSNVGWVYPALFHQNKNWLLITEAGMDGRYCGTRLVCEKGNPSYKISFPDTREIITPDGLLPKGKLPLNTPWRVVTIGSLKTIVESTLGTDVAPASTIRQTNYIKPGKSSWSWIMSKDDSIVYKEQIHYIDFAADMKWEYCLVDANWDQKIGYDKTKELAAYANSKGVDLLLWYNSAGDWNTVPFTPRSKLLTHQDRVKEFALLKSMGVKGIKIDFFGGDGRSVIAYYIGIMNDAANAGLMVNFHGATLPRGWSRTFPNLVSTEAVKGFEMITFSQRDADVEANHCTMLPFTRNVFDPMDFTPMNLYKIQARVQRRTTSAFELATSVVFLSGIQHFAESPVGMSHVPEDVKNYLRHLPSRWDDVRFIDGFPGKYAIVARRAGSKWYIGGMNGESAEKSVTMDLSFLNGKKCTVFSDGKEPLTFETQSITPTATTMITMQSQGGFVIVAE